MLRGEGRDCTVPAADRSKFTPNEMRIVRAGEIAGWVIAATMLVGVIAGAGWLERTLAAQKVERTARARTFWFAVQACHQAAPQARTWTACEDEIREDGIVQMSEAGVD